MSTWTTTVTPMGRWLRPEEAAEYLRVARSTIYKLMGERSIPSYKVGKATLLKSTDLDSYVEQNKRDRL